MSGPTPEKHMRVSARWSASLLPCLAALGISCTEYAATAPEPSESIGRTEQAIVSNPVRLAYYAVWAAQTTPEPPAHVPRDKSTHIKLALAGITPSPYTAKFWTDYNRQDIQDPQALSNAQALVAYRNAHYPGVKVVLVVGGWTLSYRFSDAVSSSGNRSSFADSCISL